jgi:hypothetical protein
MLFYLCRFPSYAPGGCSGGVHKQLPDCGCPVLLKLRGMWCLSITALPTLTILLLSVSSLELSQPLRIRDVVKLPKRAMHLGRQHTAANIM